MVFRGSRPVKGVERYSGRLSFYSGMEYPRLASMATPEIQPGTRIQARDAFGQWNERRAISEVLPGEDFPLVWVCREDEWEAAHREQREPGGVPFPLEDVRVVERAPA